MVVNAASTVYMYRSVFKTP